MRNIGNERNFLGPQLDPTELTLAGGGGEGVKTQSLEAGAFLSGIPSPISKSCRCPQWRWVPGSPRPECDLPNPNISATAPGQPLLQKILRRTQGDEIVPTL